MKIVLDMLSHEIVKNASLNRYWTLNVFNTKMFLGLWGALNSGSSSELQSLENVSHAPKKPTTVVVDVSEEIPRAFGQGRGRGFAGRNAGESM